MCTNFAWPNAKFDLEIDGTRYHTPAHHRKRDHRRKRAHRGVLRVDDDQLNDAPDSATSVDWELLAPRATTKAPRPMALTGQSRRG